MGKLDPRWQRQSRFAARGPKVYRSLVSRVLYAFIAKPTAKQVNRSFVHWQTIAFLSHFDKNDPPRKCAPLEVYALKHTALTRELDGEPFVRRGMGCDNLLQPALVRRLADASAVAAPP